MATKKPLVVASGQVRELASGDTLSGADISNTPAGNIAATTVQAAINELDSEKQATLVSGTNIRTAGGQTLVGSGDAPIVAPETHAATAKTTPADADELGITDSAASWGLKKLTFANLKAWISSLGGAGISNTPSGNISATNVQAAINELDSEKVSKTGDTISGNLNVTGNVLVTGGGGLGYGAGSGGTVTQATSKSTAVTLNKPSGIVNVNNSALNAGATAIFTFNNSSFTSSDTVLLTIVGQVADKYTVRFTHTAEGVGSISITNNTAGSLSEAIGINFVVLKAVRS